MASGSQDAGSKRVKLAVPEDDSKPSLPTVAEDPPPPAQELPPQFNDMMGALMQQLACISEEVSQLREERAGGAIPDAIADVRKLHRVSSAFGGRRQSDNTVLSTIAIGGAEEAERHFERLLSEPKCSSAAANGEGTGAGAGAGEGEGESEGEGGDDSEGVGRVERSGGARRRRDLEKGGSPQGQRRSKKDRLTARAATFAGRSTVANRASFPETKKEKSDLAEATTVPPVGQHGPLTSMQSHPLLNAKYGSAGGHMNNSRSRKMRAKRLSAAKAEYNLDHTIGEFIQSVYVKEQADHKRIERHVQWAQHKNSRFLLTPGSPLHQVWALVQQSTLSVYALFVPLQLAFADRIDPTAGQVIFWASDIICWLHIVITLRTRVKLPGESVLVAHPWAIFASYLRTWLLVDVAAALPWHVLLPGDVLGPPEARHAVWDLVPFFRLIGLARLVSVLRPSEAAVDRNLRSSAAHLSGVRELLKMSWHFLFLCHVAGCLYWIVALVELRQCLDSEVKVCWGGEQEWLPAQSYAAYLPEARASIPHDHVPSAFECYLYALNSGMLTMSGLVVMKPGGTRQAVLSLCFTMATVLVQAVVIGSVTTVLTRIGANFAHERSCRQAITTYCTFKEVPAALTQKIHDFYDYKGGVGFNEEEMMPFLPETLRLQLDIFHKRSVFLKVPFFQTCTVGQIVELVPRVSFEFATPGSHVVQEGMPVPGLYMIARGCIEVTVRNKGRLALRYAGEYVGETSLLQSMAAEEAGEVERQVAQASCVAQDWCELLLLRRADFKELVKKHPELLHRIKYYSKIKDAQNQNASVSQNPLPKQNVMHRQLQERVHEDRQVAKAHKRRASIMPQAVAAVRQGVDSALLEGVPFSQKGNRSSGKPKPAAATAAATAAAPAAAAAAALPAAAAATQTPGGQTAEGQAAAADLGRVAAAEDKGAAATPQTQPPAAAPPTLARPLQELEA